METIAIETRKDYEKKLKDWFNIVGFRPYQLEIIDMLLKGKDTFAVLSTGAGKSLTYQFLAKEKPMVLVISPLLSLMIDQVVSFSFSFLLSFSFPFVLLKIKLHLKVDSCQKMGLKAGYLGSTQKDEKEKKEILAGKKNIGNFFFIRSSKI